jgi:hypothetical protein
MILPLISIFFLNTFHPIKNILPVRTYISNNVQGKYIIDNDVDELMCFNYKSDSFIDFLAYLIKVDVEYIVSDDYFIFRKKPSNEQ